MIADQVCDLSLVNGQIKGECHEYGRLITYPQLPLAQHRKQLFKALPPLHTNYQSSILTYRKQVVGAVIRPNIIMLEAELHRYHHSGWLLQNMGWYRNKTQVGGFCFFCSICFFEPSSALDVSGDPARLRHVYFTAQKYTQQIQTIRTASPTCFSFYFFFHALDFLLQNLGQKTGELVVFSKGCSEAGIKSFLTFPKLYHLRICMLHQCKVAVHF